MPLLDAPSLIIMLSIFTMACRASTVFGSSCRWAGSNGKLCTRSSALNSAKDSSNSSVASNPSFTQDWFLASWSRVTCAASSAVASLSRDWFPPYLTSNLPVDLHGLTQEGVSLGEEGPAFKPETADGAQLPGTMSQRPSPIWSLSKEAWSDWPMTPKMVWPAQPLSWAVSHITSCSRAYSRSSSSPCRPVLTCLRPNCRNLVAQVVAPLACMAWMW
mmetsp:Transcript_135009/g.419546  ORF Transcript_135009/g.419546 Transcript_135009/m.419546 type:complete len:217 (-) Transcript_135009:20-670(-)